MSYHIELGAQLASLRKSGVLIVASGNIVHNLRGMNWALENHGFDWAQRFNESAKELMLTSPGDFATLDDHADFDNAVPTPDHFIPALYLAGLAEASNEEDTSLLIDGYAYGSLSMTAYTLGLDCERATSHEGTPVAELEVRPDESNIQTSAITERDGGVVVSIRVVPGARISEVAGINGSALRVRVAASPIDGKANREVLEVLANALGLKPRQLTLLRGEKSRDKHVFVPDMTVNQASDALLRSTT